MKFVVTITGLSCAGKSTLERYLKGRGFVAVISTTTRSPRAGEVNGQNYYYISLQEFQEKVSAGEMVEWVEYNGQCYGVTKTEFERVFAENRPVVVVVEPNGQKQVKLFGSLNGWHVYSVFLDAPVKLIAERFIKRLLKEPTDDKQAIQAYVDRLATMMSVERKWLDRAWDGYYDAVLERFDAKNEEDILDLICAQVKFDAPHQVASKIATSVTA